MCHETSSDNLSFQEPERILDWLPYSLASMICMALRSNIWSEVAWKVSYEVTFYYSVGYILFVAPYYGFRAYRSKKVNGSYWVD